MFLILGLGSFALGLVLIPLIVRLSKNKGWFDAKDHRKTHSGDISRLGGLGIAISLFATIVVGICTGFFIFPNLVSLSYFLIFLFGLLIGHVIGLIDDFRNLTAKTKFLVQIIGAVLICFSGVTVPGFVVPFTDLYFDFGFLSFPLTLLWIIAISNAINLIDGIDGFAGSTSLVASIIYCFIHYIHQNSNGLIISVILVGATLAFLFYNKPKAKIFMGDGGAYLLGFMLATIPFIPKSFNSDFNFLEQLKLNQFPTLESKSQIEFFDVIIVLLILALPIADMVYAVIRRMSKGQPFYKPDRSHIHHKLSDLGLKPWGLLGVLIPSNLVFGLFAVGAIIVRKNFGISTPFYGAILLVGFLTVVIFFNFIRRQYKKIQN